MKISLHCTLACGLALVWGGPGALAQSLAPGTFSFSAQEFTVDEDAGLAAITVTRTNGILGIVSVQYETINGSATDGLDYRAARGSLFFASGETTKSFLVPILDDALAEGDETVGLVLTNATGGAGFPGGLPSASATLRIVDNELPRSQLAFSLPSYAVAENAPGFTTITVIRSGASAGMASVQYQTLDGTATAGMDYQESAGTLVFADGQLTASFTVMILDDRLAESEESVQLVLTNAVGARLPDGLPSASATLGILDDDFAHGQLDFSSDVYEVAEDTPGSVTITVTRSGGSLGTAAVDYRTSNGTAIPGADYQQAAGTLTFADGQTNASFFVVILDDALADGEKTVGLLLTNATGGATFPDGLASASATLRILDNEPPRSQLAFSSPLYTVAENQPGFATITVLRIGATAGPATVDYRTVDGTARAGTNYLSASGTLLFGAGQTSASFLVTVLDDSSAEGDKTVGLILTNATGGAAFTNGLPSLSATLRIVDNEVAHGQLGFSQTNYTVAEAAGFALVTILRTGGSAGVVSVRCRTAGGTATAGLDYTPVDGVLAFAAGETNKTVMVPVAADQLVEATETVGLILTNATGGATLAGGGSSATATLTLLDSNSPPITPPVVENCIRVQDTVQFGFQAEAGYDYFVEYKQGHQGNWLENWLVLTNFRAKFQPVDALIRDSLTNGPVRFYRIRKEDCRCD